MGKIDRVKCLSPQAKRKGKTKIPYPIRGVASSLPHKMSNCHGSCPPRLMEIGKVLVGIAANTIIAPSGRVDVTIRIVVLLCTFETMRA